MRRRRSRLPRPRSARALEWLALALVLAGVVVLYVPALGTQFFADDFLFLDQVRGRSLWQALQAPDPLSNFFRPVSRQLYFWVVAGLTHESPFAFRVGNLITLLVAIVLLWRLARRLAGARAALFTAAFFGLHYAADVPVRWACGSQELLAIVFALAAILLHVSDRRLLAGVAMLLAALSKEVVLLTPLIAIVADHRPREPWLVTARRAWPLAAAVLVWGVIFLSMPHRHTAQGTEVEFDLIKSPLAAIVHLIQVAAGLEWRTGNVGALRPEPPPIVPVLAALAALVLVWRASAARPVADSARKAAEDARHVLRVGAVWIVVATAPVVAVALLWSAYYYLFAMCGLALVLGLLLARAPVWAACAVVLVSAVGSAHARELSDFGIGRDPFTPCSHINRSYIERSNQVTSSYLGSLARAYPKFPRGSTVFFGGLMSNVAFQRGDGPLLRWAYRDTSLRSYYLNAFSRRTARPGPLYFFVGSGDTLVEMERSDDLFLRVAFGMIVSDELEGARDALDVARERMPGSTQTAYWGAWVSYALGDTAAGPPPTRRSGLRARRRAAGRSEHRRTRRRGGEGRCARLRRRGSPGRERRETAFARRRGARTARRRHADARPGGSRRRDRGVRRARARAAGSVRVAAVGDRADLARASARGAGLAQQVLSARRRGRG
jgi:hypothetical protein